MPRVTVKNARSILGEAQGDKRFYCADGRILKDLPELELALHGMTEETFRYHSNDTRSDFSDWVRDVFGDEKLSRDLRKSASREQAAKSVTERVSWLKSKTGKKN